jgi:hypothetical protein
MPRYLLLSFLSLALAGCACSTQPTAQGATRIETDQKTGVVRIISDNHEVAYFDRKGTLHTPSMVSEPVDQLGESTALK